MRIFIASITLCIGAISCAPASQTRATPVAAASVDRNAERSIVATVERLFDAMRTRDTATIRQLFLPGVAIVSVRTGGTRAHRSQTVPDFIRAIAGSTEELRERMWSPEVRIDGPVATLWAPYDFNIGTRFSHCGHDAVQLALAGGQWIITGLTYTVQTESCTGPPT